MGRTQQIGDEGETVAARYLLDRGFELLHRNWRSGHYELDIVARRNGVLHIVEVKCRKAGALTAPEEAMTPSKFRALCRAAEAYINLYGLDVETQFDLIAIDRHADGSCAIRYFPEVMAPHW